MDERQREADSEPVILEVKGCIVKRSLSGIYLEAAGAVACTAPVARLASV